jgi:hypothetical protein
MGLFGFMDGETPQPGFASLPAETITQVKETLATMLGSSTGRFDIVFNGPDQGQHRQGARPGRPEARAVRPRPVPQCRRG